jgi:Cft2 family RNA processing exonuclease
VGAVLEKGGKVLMPVDATGRVLELLSVLHRYWVAQNINKDSFRLVFLSHQAYNTVEMARGQLEWMSKDMQREFDVKRDNPFSLPRLYLCHRCAVCVLIIMVYESVYAGPSSTCTSSLVPRAVWKSLLSSAIPHV